MCIIIINRTNKLIGIQHEKKHGKVSKNSSNTSSSSYFDNKMIEDWRRRDGKTSKWWYLGTFDECAYVKDNDDLCAY